VNLLPEGWGNGSGRRISLCGGVSSILREVHAVAHTAREAVVAAPACLYTGTAPTLARSVAPITASH